MFSYSLTIYIGEYEVSLLYILALIVILILVIYIFSLRSENRYLQKKPQSDDILIQSLNSRITELDLLSTQQKKQLKEYYNLKITLNNKLNELRLEIQDLLRYKQLNDKILESNLVAFPYLAGIIADFRTYDIELLAQSLNWGYSQQRMKKVASIREIRADAKARIEEAKLAAYQLAYLIQLYPELEDVIQMDFREVTPTLGLPKHDPIRDWLSKEEFSTLSEPERAQLALDHYISSTHKTKWQIGRDYELSVGYEYEQHGYTVIYYGSLERLEDMGRDLIASKGKETQIIQCKFWSQKKEIHEKHIFNLFGTVVLYRLEHNISSDDKNVKGVFVTNIKLSSKAKSIADILGIHYVENHPYSEFPRIKCNIGKDVHGQQTYIYHLPMDQQYDSVKLINPGETKVFSVKEAEKLGFRRAFRWHSSKDE